MKILIRVILVIFIITSSAACSSDDVKDLVDLAVDDPDREQIDVSRMGVNNFFVNREFGSTSAQYSEIKNTLGLRFVRVLFAWTDGVQPTPGSAPNYGFYDQILSSVPSGVDVVVVLAHTPGWITDPANWVDGNPRTTWVNRWLKPTVTRYKDHGSIIGWEVWNEPDNTVVASDAALSLEDPVAYMEMLRLGSQTIRNISSRFLVLNAATRSIQQNFPGTLNYNKDLRDLGAKDFVDIWNIHYYGEQYEKVVQDGGVEDFLDGLGMPIWITESGAQGPNNQLAYVETAWPFLRDKISAIDRIYYYEFGNTVPIEQNYGLKTTNPDFPVSDLYIYLRDN